MFFRLFQTNVDIFIFNSTENLEILLMPLIGAEKK